MPTAFEIRVASESDAATLARLRYELRSSLRQVVEESDPFIERCTVWMKERLRDKKMWRCWIAEHEGQVLGSIWTQIVEKIPNPVSENEHYLYITNFYVSAEWRNRGIGSKLLTTALQWAKNHDAHSVILWPTELSRPLYLRHGFSEARDLMELGLYGTPSK